MKKKILIISGGISKEREISLDTGRQVAKELIKNNYIVKIVEPNLEIHTAIKSFKPNIIFNALHGQFGEDGYIQSILETKNIRTVIAATGFNYDFSWIKPATLDDFGYPVTKKGVSDVPGLYFMGLNWMVKRKSGIIFGVAEDANYLAPIISGNIEKT